MSMLTEAYQMATPHEKHDNAGPELTHARWGYMITSQEPAGLVARLGCLGARYIGVVMLLVALGLWVAPGTHVHTDLVPLKLGISVLFCSLGLAAIWTSGNISRDEMQVDLERKELRRGVRRANGRFTPRVDLPLREAGELFLSRGVQNDQLGGEEAVLYIRRKNALLALEVASGPEDLLIPLQHRLAADLRRFAAING